MAQQAARAEVPPPPRPADSADDSEELGHEWVVLRDCRLRPAERGSSPTVLIHPERGVAVVDILPFETPDPVEAVRYRLDAARFSAIFAGDLPVVHLRLTPRQMPFLPSLLDDAFAAQPPLCLPGGDAWVGVATRAMLAEQRVPRAEWQPAQEPATDVRQRRRRTAGLRKAGAVLLCLAALGGVLALVLPDAAAPVPASVPDAPPAPVAVITPEPPVPPARPVPEGAAAREATGPTTPPPVAEPVVVAPPPPPPPPPPVPSRTSALPERQQPAPVFAPPPPPAVQAPPPAASPPRAPQAASTPRRSEPNPPPARRAPERAAPRKQQEARTGSPQASGGAAAPPAPEAASERCRRVSTLVGSGAPIGDADIRFFNETCIRW
jgi:hypothetical protein